MTGCSPVVVNVCVAVATPSVTVAVYSWPSTSKVTVPAASAGVTFAVRVVGSPTRATVGATVTSVSVPSTSTVTPASSELGRYWSVLVGANAAVTR